MENTFLIITSIAGSDNPVLKQFAEEASKHNLSFIVIGDTKSPGSFDLPGCDFYSIERQKALIFRLSKIIPYQHYARKNLGYLIAISRGAETIIETDDDNRPLPEFWQARSRKTEAHLMKNNGWLNVYRYFTEGNIWPRGFALENLQEELPKLTGKISLECPIQQGLADENPDVDAIYRLILPLPLSFNRQDNVALGEYTICPFNSQNTTWFKEAFPLLYLPSFCTFRMTDIWRSFVAQRIAWTCGWPLLFHNSTVWQLRNEHNLMIDFRDEISGYENNKAIMENLGNLRLKSGIEHLNDNMIACYQMLIDMKLVSTDEMSLLKTWLADLEHIC